MYITLPSASLIGLTSVPLSIEVDLHKGQTHFALIGLPDAAIKEARDRLYAALKNSGYTYPFNFRITVNLAPADVPKEGTGYDLAMAVGIIAANDHLDLNFDDCLIVGELALDGAVRHVPGILPLAMFAKEEGYNQMFVPVSDAAEAGLVEGLRIFPVRNLSQLMRHLKKEEDIPEYVPSPADSTEEKIYDYDLAF